MFDRPHEGTTRAGNNENKPETSVALVHIRHVEDTMTMCQPSLRWRRRLMRYADRAMWNGAGEAK